jgi:hypothetical protein
MMNASLVQRTSVRDEALAILSRLGTLGSSADSLAVLALDPSSQARIAPRDQIGRAEQPARMTDAVGPGKIGLRSAFQESLACFLPLVRCRSSTCVRAAAKSGNSICARSTARRPRSRP